MFHDPSIQIHADPAYSCIFTCILQLHLVIRSLRLLQFCFSECRGHSSQLLAHSLSRPSAVCRPSTVVARAVVPTFDVLSLVKCIPGRSQDMDPFSLMAILRHAMHAIHMSVHYM